MHRISISFQAADTAHLMAASANVFCSNFSITPQILCETDLIGGSLINAIVTDVLEITCNGSTITYPYQASDTYQSGGAVVRGTDSKNYSTLILCELPPHAGLQILQPGLINLTPPDAAKGKVFDLISQTFAAQGLSYRFPRATVMTSTLDVWDFRHLELGSVGFDTLYPKVFCV